MQVGAMNNPTRELVGEMRWMADMGLEFLDLTLEPPAAAPWKVQPKTIRNALADLNMGVVGHTAYYLPFGSAFESVRRAAVEETKHCLEIFGAVGAKWVNLHPDRHAPFHPRRFILDQNIKSIRELVPIAKDNGVGLMIENVPGEFNSRVQLADLLESVPGLGLHLDIGHCNLLVPSNTALEIIEAFGSRIQHVHLHDNKGGYADLHLPLGVGTLDYVPALKALQNAGYDGTITLEVFSEDHHFLGYSRDVLNTAWASLKTGSSRPVVLVES